MTNDPRVALKALIAALEHHLETARNSDVVSDAVFEDAEARVQDAFFTYDDALFTCCGVEVPLELVGDFDEDEDVDTDDDDDDDDDDDADDEDGYDIDEEALEDLFADAAEDETSEDETD